MFFLEVFWICLWNVFWSLVVIGCNWGFIKFFENWDILLVVIIEILEVGREENLRVGGKILELEGVIVLDVGDLFLVKGLKIIIFLFFFLLIILVGVLIEFCVFGWLLLVRELFCNVIEVLFCFFFWLLMVFLMLVLISCFFFCFCWVFLGDVNLFSFLL